jgi:serine/threonine-protein kinase
MQSSDDDRIARAQERVGTVLNGKYRVDRVLGAGGMAVVYAVTHRNQKQLAVKMLHPEISSRPELHRRFLREGYVANSVKHPGAVAVLDDDTTDDGAAFLVMELLVGVGVEEACARFDQRLSPRAALAIAHQLLDVLAAAHEHGIVHRDIKPANLFLTTDRKVKVLDFGVARLREAADDAHTATHTGVVLGTPAFMAPEQAMAEARDIDAQSDLWAVGATLFTLISGELVHVGANAQQLMVRAATSKARSLSAVSTSAPAPIVAVVDRALAFDKRDRWPDAAAMRDAVRDAYLEAFSEVISDAPLAPLIGSTSGSPRAAAHADTLASDPHPRVAAATSAPSTSQPQLPGALQSTAHTVATDPPPPQRARRWPYGAAAAALAVAAVGSLALRASHPAGAPAPQSSTSAPSSAAAAASPARQPEAPGAIASTPLASAPPPPPSVASSAHRPPAIHSPRPAPSPVLPTPAPTVDPGSVR